VPESIESLKAELARLWELIARAKDAGNTALADALTEDAARCLMEQADIHTPLTPDEPSRPVVQQQQQIPPKEPKEPKEKE
jgi:hypothetical protein